MSFPQFPSSAGPCQSTPSPKLSRKSLSPLTLIPTVISTSSIAAAVRQSTKSPAIKAVTATTSTMIPPITLSNHHSRSHSVPSLQRRSVELSAAVPPSTYSSSANLRNLQSGGWFPKSPRLKPLMSPGPVTPMQLEEDLEYRFPSVGTTPIRSSPLVLPVQVEEELVESEQQVLDTPLRSRS